MKIDKLIKRYKRICFSELALFMDFSEEAITYVFLYLWLAVILLVHLNFKILSLRKKHSI